ncbi:uncharacterized protein H6S33_006916 [Morchella sextelata]|uniref:uncharacterized protein n=1 Tax=Morchella sextelata TaxID=1174677 RepID=UPI001D03AC25|nr:uncharacterized protein H6S33_006916 [Morchella sextelata]KAH0604539.1 hypothetical protein H6S33_006916 [Morchella sextelata]
MSNIKRHVVPRRSTSLGSSHLSSSLYTPGQALRIVAPLERARVKIVRSSFGLLFLANALWLRWSPQSISRIHNRCLVAQNIKLRPTTVLHQSTGQIHAAISTRRSGRLPDLSGIRDRDNLLRSMVNRRIIGHASVDAVAISTITKHRQGSRNSTTSLSSVDVAPDFLLKYKSTRFKFESLNTPSSSPASFLSSFSLLHSFSIIIILNSTHNSSIQNFLVTMTLAATSAAVPAYKRGSDLATYDQCMTIAYDANQGMAFYRVPAARQAEVASNCRTCIWRTAAQAFRLGINPSKRGSKTVICWTPPYGRPFPAVVCVMMGTSAAGTPRTSRSENASHIEKIRDLEADWIARYASGTHTWSIRGEAIVSGHLRGRADGLYCMCGARREPTSCGRCGRRSITTPPTKLETARIKYCRRRRPDMVNQHDRTGARVGSNGIVPRVQKCFKICLCWVM